MSERRLQSKVVGPARPGFLIISFGAESARFEAEVAVDRIPSELRLPNSTFVSVVAGRDFISIESRGREWIEIQDKIRDVLNTIWDPIGVSGEVSDEYDGYILSLYSLIQAGADRETIAAHLRSIETRSMGMEEVLDDVPLQVADQLLALRLPRIA